MFFTAFILITSCSSDDNSAQNNLILPKAVSFIFPNEQLGTNSVGIIVYDGNKIVSLTREYSKFVYTYEGDRITKQTEFDVDTKGKEYKSREVVYIYENGKLKSRTFKEGFPDNNSEALSINTTIYTHLSNGLITYVNYSDSNIKQGEGSLELKDGNVIKESTTFGASQTLIMYEYDTKPNALKNVLGFDLLLNEVAGFGKNNIVKMTRTSTEFPNPAVYTKSYTYNENGYPIRAFSYDSSGNSIEYETRYAY